MSQRQILIRGEDMELKNVSKTYGKNAVLTDVNLSLGAGITGLIGKNGAGKTTLMKILCEVIPNFTGEFKRHGSDQVGYLIEDPKYYKAKSGMYNIHYFANVFSKKRDQTYIKMLIQDMGMESYIHKKVKTYSMGMKQKLGLVIALLQKPKYLILDEPTNGMDPDGSIDVLNIIKSLVQKYDISVLISSHKLEDIESVADDIVFISNGRLGDKTKVAALNDGISYEFTFASQDVERALAIFDDEGLEIKQTQETLIIGQVNDFQKTLKDLFKENIVPVDVNKVKHSVKDYYFQQMQRGKES
jgi:ABC-2 type transport system ATP-binding protein